MSYKKIASHIKNAIGLNANSIGMITISLAVDRRMRETNISERHSYLQMIESDQAEMDALTEAVIVPETWFLRDTTPYSQIINHINTTRKKSRRPAKILSIPCSTGEEPYSVVTYLMAHDIPMSNYEIDAVDISKEAIIKAKKAEYENHSFRTHNDDFKNAYFTLKNNTYKVKKSIRDKVLFSQGNILSEDLRLDHAPYDIIICRNLLIYFNTETKQRVFKAIDALLDDNGILILGHAESVREAGGKFTLLTKQDPNVFQKQPTTVLTLTPRKNPKIAQASKPASSAQIKKSSTKLLGKVANHKIGQPQSRLKIESAYDLADKGQLAEALDLCREYIDQNKLSEKAYYLAGIVSDALGLTNEAKKYLKNTLYLNPEHLEALTHLSLIAEQDNNHEELLLLKRRIQKIKAKGIDK